MKTKLKRVDPERVTLDKERLKEFELKASSVWSISDAFIACVYKEMKGEGLPIGSVTSVELVGFYHEKGGWLTEYVKVNYRGGAYAVRNASGNSVSADFKAIAQLVDGGYYSENDDYEEHLKNDIRIGCQPLNAEGCRLYFEEAVEFGVVAIDVPWGNSECIGVYKGLDEAAKAATEHLESCANTFGYERNASIKPAEGFQEGEYFDPKTEEIVEDDGYRYLIAECPKGGCVYVLEEPCDGSEPTLFGPYKDYEEANKELFAGQTDENDEPIGFKLTAGTFGPGFYPVDIPEAAVYHIYVMEKSHE